MEMNVESEPQPRSEDHHERFTFPSDNPVKRIVFILYRGKGAVRECKTIDQTPTEGTKAFPLAWAPGTYPKARWLSRRVEIG